MSMEKKRPQLSLDELHQLRWLLGGILTLLSVWTVFYLEIDAWILMAVATFAVGACLVKPSLPAKLPRAVHFLAFPVALAFFLADIWVKGEVLSAIVRLDILLLLYRGIGYRQRREDLQVIVLGLFLVVVAGVLTISLVFAVQILAFTSCALALLLVITLIGAAEEGKAPPADAVAAQPASWTSVRWRRLFAHLRQTTDWRILALGAVLFAGVVVVTALLFMALPRFQLENSLFLERFAARKARTGFSDSIKFGDVTEIQQDHRVALRVDVDPSKVPDSPYWRMLVLDRYDNSSFRLAVSRRDENQTEFVVTGKNNTWAAEPVFWTLYFEPGVSRFLPLIGPFNELSFSQRQKFNFNPQLGLIRLLEDPVSMVAYRVEGFDVSGRIPDQAFATRWRGRDPLLAAGEEANRFYLGVPEADRLTLSRIVDDILASEAPKPEPLAFGKPPVVRDVVTTEQLIARTNAWLRRHHSYTLSPRIPPVGAADPLVRWLVSGEPGHCELFAGSLVLLARAAGYPARVVTGFRGGTWNSYSQNFTLRNSDAHAWAEIFDAASEEWLRADALGEPFGVANVVTQTERRHPARVDRGWAARVESLRVFWYRRIVSFDQHSQLDTLKAMKDATETSGRRLRDFLASTAARIKIWMTTPWNVQRIGGLVAAAGLLVAAWWCWREWGRRVWRRATNPRARREDPVRQDAGRWLEKLNACKTPPPESAAVVADLQRLRFAARATWPEPSRVFRSARHALRSARRRRRRDG